MKKILLKTFVKIAAHKFITCLILAALLGGGYLVIKNSGNDQDGMRYILAPLRRGPLVVSVSGTGQVSVLNQIDIKSAVSGKVISLLKKNGDHVSTEEVISQLDAEDANRAIRDAENSLASAKLQLSILKESSANITKLISDGFNEVSDTFLELPAIVTGLKAALYDTTIGSYENLVDSRDANLVTPLMDAAKKSYESARAAYDKAFVKYHTVSRYDSDAAITGFIGETYSVTVNVADAVKNAINVIDFVNDYNTQHNRTIASAYTVLIGNYRTNLTNYTATINNRIASLDSIRSSINNAPLNIASQELAVRTKENALEDARDNLSDYVIRAPFPGIVTKINLKVGDSVSASTVAVTLITSRRLAEISLNEVDTAGVKVGQKSNLTFDAIPDLKVVGEVTEIDAIGTVNQGVVTYNVKVAFDTEDDRVKPGMTVSADIITDIKEGVLLLPNSALKSQGNRNYVEVPVSGSFALEGEGRIGRNVSLSVPPERRDIEIDISNDDFTEVISGLDEGDVIVLTTFSSAGVSANATQGQDQNTTFRFPGLPRTGQGGGAR